MASIFQEIEIEWDGETYTVTPTMRLINKIENEVSLAKLAYRAQSGDVPMSHVATVFAHLLKAGGCEDISSEKVWYAMNLGGEMSVEKTMDILNVTLSAFYPKTESSDDLKKSQKKA